MNDGLIKQIELAINDPGSVIGERLNNGVTYEPLATWQARAVIATIADSVEGVGKPYPVEERAFHVVRASYGEELEHFRAADRATLSSFPATSRDDAYAMAKALNHVVRFHVERAQALSTPAQGDEVREALEPFATFYPTFANEDGWTSPMTKERIVDWFGPTDFRRAAKVFATLKDSSHEG